MSSARINLTSFDQWVIGLLSNTPALQKKGIHMWPCFFGPKDFAAMTASNCVFTRKLHPDVSGDLYDMLDQHMAAAL